MEVSGMRRVVGDVGVKQMIRGIACPGQVVFTQKTEDIHP